MVIYDLVLVAIVVYTLPLPGKEIGGGHGYIQVPHLRKKVDGGHTQ